MNNENTTGIFRAAVNTIGVSTAGTERMRIDSSGNVGIGTTSPNQKLEVNGGALKVAGSSSTVFRFYDTNTTSNYGTFYKTDGTTPLAYLGGAAGAALGGGTANDFVVRAPAGHLLLYSDSGNVGIGTISPATALDVNGDIKTSTGNFRSGTRADFYLSLQFDRNMVLYDGGGAVWNSGTQVSDIRLKQDIKPLEDVLPILMQLHAIRFRYIKSVDETQSSQIGVVAQEILKHFPELVYHDKVSDRYMVYYDKLTSLLIKSVQELKHESDQRYLELKNENEELKMALCELNQRLKICRPK